MTTVKVIVYSKLKQQQQQQKVIVRVRKVSKSVFRCPSRTHLQHFPFLVSKLPLVFDKVYFIDFLTEKLLGINDT